MNEPLRDTGLASTAIRPRPSVRRIRSVLLRGLGLVYVAAFGSLAVQMDGLIGAGGILPAKEFLERVHHTLGSSAYWQLPTLFWLNASDRALKVSAWGGVLMGVLVAVGLWPKPLMALLWATYLSIAVVGQDFLNYQWDALLLEAGFLGILLAPWGKTILPLNGEPARAIVFSFHWLVFRLMFLSGVIKLRSGDPSWSSLEALRFHYETQPLPTWTSWYAHQWPDWFQCASLAFMFIVELFVPFLMLGNRGMRRAAFVLMVALQLGILATGNYGFFNLLTIVLCVSLLDDRDLSWLPGTSRFEGEAAMTVDQSRVFGRVRRYVLGCILAVIFVVTSYDALEVVVPRVPSFWPVVLVRGTFAPFRSMNTYGLFAVMTTKRPEITIEGTADGVNWHPYRFWWKPGELDRRPRFTTPFMPRLDWQMWFAALAGDCRSQIWFLRFEQRLLEGSPPVLALLRENPFPMAPPRSIRARLSIYRFTSPPSRVWWYVEGNSVYCPPVQLSDLDSFQ